MQLSYFTTVAIVLVVVEVPAAFGRDLTLDEAVAIAKAQSPLVAIEQARLDEAEADDTVARAALFPRLSASLSYAWLDDGRLSPLPSATNVGMALYGEEAYAAVRGKQVVFDGLRGWRARSATARGIDAAQAGVTASQADAVLAATVGFARLLAVQSLCDVARTAAERQRAFVALTRARLATGRGSELDALKAEAQRLDAERALVAARGAEASAQAQLRRVLGIEEVVPLSAVGVLADSAGASVDESTLLGAALAHDPDVGRVTAQLEQARALAAAVRGGYFPEVSVQGTYGYRRRDVGGEAPEWTAGLYLEWGIFEGGATLGQVDKAAARFAALEESARALRLQIAAEVSETVSAWNTAAASVEASREAALASERALEAAGALYELGRATALDVLTAQSELSRAEAAVVQAQADLATAQARAARLVGLGVRGVEGQ
ncbi:MAG: TolC family protein [Deltaproteobacteria bacterium]|nr:TolC family protein [Deltaproteobacteria bacterium]